MDAYNAASGRRAGPTDGRPEKNAAGAAAERETSTGDSEEETGRTGVKEAPAGAAVRPLTTRAKAPSTPPGESASTNIIAAPAARRARESRFTG